MKIRITYLVLMIVIIFAMSACGPGQLLGPTPTPTLTPTPVPTPTPTPVPVESGDWEASIVFITEDGETGVVAFSFTVAEDGSQIEKWSLFDLAAGQITMGQSLEIVAGTFKVENTNYVGNTKIAHTIEGAFVAPDRVEGTFVISYGSARTYDGEWSATPKP